MWRLWIMLVVGCSDAEPRITPDAGDAPLTYEVTARWNRSPSPNLGPRPTIHIDGVQAESRVFEYPTTAAALAASHVLELRHGDQVVFTVHSPLATGCLSQVTAAASAWEGWCAYETGELRYAMDQAHSIDGSTCIGDGFCRPRCFPVGTYCAAGERCTSIYVSLDPLATHLDCVPVGSKIAGDTCELVVDAAGMHDDCGLGLLCVDGACRATCLYGSPELPADCTTCSHVSGHAPEMGICN